jgi:hypothetical protein
MNPSLSNIIGKKNEAAVAVASPVRPHVAQTTSRWAMVKSWWPVLKDTASKWSADKAPRLGAALSYYTVFSLNLPVRSRIYRRLCQLLWIPHCGGN